MTAAAGARADSGNGSESDHEQHVAFLLEHEKVQEVQRYISPASSAQQQQDEAAKRKDSRMLTATFSLTVILIFGVIVFSIWLSVEVGMNGRRIWSSGGSRGRRGIGFGW
jgi:hypothetical protein